jgi:hypothetical protein
MTQKIQTVNVIEHIKSSETITIHSFHDNDEGNKESEELYFKIAKENGYIGTATNADEFYDDEGDCWSSGDYSVAIIHS